jgi:hypothetical protein
LGELKKNPYNSVYAPLQNLFRLLIFYGKKTAALWQGFAWAVAVAHFAVVQGWTLLRTFWMIWQFLC